MIQQCQSTEITEQEFPELYQFYHHFPEKYPYLLATTSQSSSETDVKNESQTFYDVLFIEPEDYLKLDYHLKLSTSIELKLSSDSTFLDAFDQWYRSEQGAVSQSQQNGCCEISLPFMGGWFIFLAYELAQQIEPCLELPLDEMLLPVAYAARVKMALIFDHTREKLFFISEPGIDHHRAYQSLVLDSQAILQSRQSNIKPEELLLALDEEDDEIFLKSVSTVKDYIKEGDVFQVNLSRLWQAQINATDFQFDSQINAHSRLAATLYQLLSIANPAPFSGVASFASEQGVASVISSSPERLLKIHNQQLESRPIAGTRPRSGSEKEDIRLMQELHKHPKEQAEHIMLIDLIRNDLGRVCEPGTVVVDELMSNESYAHVHHIVSNVIGQMQASKTPSDAIKALFPGGTITGCPKVRCMEIISELEQHSRGAYTGSMGYINLDGSMDLNILIRTMVLGLTAQENSNDYSQMLSFRAGAGLVFDSVAVKELQETRAKAKGLLKALQG